jgi:hypothetical protein
MPKIEGALRAFSPPRKVRTLDAITNNRLPHRYLKLDAFNLVEGAAFMLTDQPDPRVWVAEKVYRDGNFEIVSVWAHDGTQDEVLGHEQAFRFGYNQKVALVGIVINPQDVDDNNWGTELSAI